jgi:hypothetical protein
MLKPGRIVIAGVLCLLFLAAPAFASSGSFKQSQALSLTLQGVITNAGSQVYNFGGGTLVQGTLFGHTLSPGAVSFSLYATVHGVQSVSGWGSLQLSYTGGHGGGSGWTSGYSNNNNGGHSSSSGFSALITLTSAIPAAIFPITLNPDQTTYANCDPQAQKCNSEIPLFFTGIAAISSTGNNGPNKIPIAIESPYWNPLGGPIVITSLDSTTNPSIFLVVSYNTATIDWSGVQLQGVISGTFGTETVSGLYGQGVSSHEDLVSAKESDLGGIAFTSMSDQTLDAVGGFFGHTSFSLSGSFDCAPEFGLPEGTCTATGATSDGTFGMIGKQGTIIAGKYHTDWSVPSLFTLTTVIASVIQR